MKDSGRPRVALVYDQLFPATHGGGERRYYEIGRRLTPEFEVAYFHYGPQAPGDQGAPTHRFHTGGAIPLYTRGGRRSVFQNVDFARRLLRPLMAYKPDLIDCSSVSYAALPICATVARACGAPFVITWHEYWGRAAWASYLPRPLAEMAALFERAAPSWATCNVANSRFTAERLESRAGVRATVIPNGVDWDTISRVKPFPAETDVLFVSRLIREKGADLLLEAVRLLGNRGIPLRVTIIGDGPERPTVERLASAAGPAIAVEVIPGVEDDLELYGRMKAAKLLALPSSREGFSLVVAEAQACGAVPVVVRAPDSAAPHLIEPGRTGVVCDPAPLELAEAMLGLLKNDEYRATLRGNALRISEPRDWKYPADETARLFNTLIAAKRKVKTSPAPYGERLAAVSR